MRAVVQRVSGAELEIDGEVQAAIGRGLVALLGVAQDDTEEDAAFVARKIAGLRVFGDADGKMNLSVGELDPPGAILVVPNFTVCGDTRRGRRPSFAAAAPPAAGERLFEAVCRSVEDDGIVCARGVFGAHMHVRIENDGPVTVLVESPGSARDARS